MDKSASSKATLLGKMPLAIADRRLGRKIESRHASGKKITLPTRPKVKKPYPFETAPSPRITSILHQNKNGELGIANISRQRSTMTLLATDDLKTPEGKWNNCSFENNTVQLNDPTLTIHPPPRKKDIKCSQGDKVVVATMRKSVLEGLEYPPLVDPYLRTKSGAFSLLNKTHPASARIGTYYTQHLEAVYLKKYGAFSSAQFNEEDLGESHPVECEIISSIKKRIKSVGIPHATAKRNCGPISAPEVDLCLSPKRKAKLVYEVLNCDDTNGDLHREMFHVGRKYLYDMTPELSTNACGDGRTHSFKATNMSMERTLNGPVVNNVENAILDTEHIFSLDQKAHFRGPNEMLTVSFVGVHNHHRHSSMTEKKRNSFFDQSNLRLGTRVSMVENELAHAHERYWHYVNTEMKDDMIAPVNPIWMGNIVKMISRKLLPPGAESLARYSAIEYIRIFGNIVNSVIIEKRVRPSASLNNGREIKSLPIFPSRHERVIHFQLSAARLFARVWSYLNARIQEFCVDMETDRRRDGSFHMHSYEATDTSDGEGKPLYREVENPFGSNISLKHLKRLSKAVGLVVENILSTLRQDVDVLKRSIESLLLESTSSYRIISSTAKEIANSVEDIEKLANEGQVTALSEVQKVYLKIWERSVFSNLSCLDFELMKHKFFVDVDESKQISEAHSFPFHLSLAMNHLRHKFQNIHEVILNLMKQAIFFHKKRPCN